MNRNLPFIKRSLDEGQGPSIAENLRLFQLADIALVDANLVLGCVLAIHEFGWYKQWIVDEAFGQRKA